ncbi:hypothetical protein J3A83DRAFT_4225637, partial [Scleroderma citrinum]
MGHLSVKVVVKVHLSLCLAVIIGLPAVTPKQDMNNANFTLTTYNERLAQWLCIYPFLYMLTFVNLFVVTLHFCSVPRDTKADQTSCAAGLDTGVHISEEASNAAVAVPWAIVSADIIAGLLGLAIYFLYGCQYREYP